MVDGDWLELPPHAGRLTNSLTSISYDFHRAVADIVDNSIPVGSTKVWVVVNDSTEGDFGEPYVAIVDNGSGMGDDEIGNALLYGSERNDSENNLGRFGLGLKTASTSQARIVTVATRKDGNDDFSILQWNLNFLNSEEANGRWLALKPSLEEIPSELLDLIDGSSGTIVLWTDLSPMIPNINELHIANITAALRSRAKACREHLSLVFHRFISGTATNLPQGNIEFFLNDWKLEANDPLVEGHRAHRLHKFGDTEGFAPEHMIEDPAEGRVSLALRGKSIRFSGHVIPRTDEWHDELLPNGLTREANECKKRASRGDLIGNQGIYFYRLDRLIQEGKWSRLYGADAHTSLARLAIDADRSWDDEINLNVNKTAIQVPSDLKRDFKDIISSLRAYAEDVYRLENDQTRIWPEEEEDPNPPPPPPPPPPIPPPPPPPPPPEELNPFTVEEQNLIQEMMNRCESEQEGETMDSIVSRVRERRVD